MAIDLPDLPFPYQALEPHLSATTLKFHHDKHHRAYVDKTNTLIKGTPLAGRSLEDIVVATAADPAQRALYNNAAQAWSHSFYWRCLRPQGGGAPTGAVAERIAADFGGPEHFAESFAAAATGQFGSGWAWLVLDKDALRVVATANADVPLTRGQTPLLVVDVWEHAYYLDYQNRRPDYVSTFLGKLVNWDFVNEQLAAAAPQTARRQASGKR
ncbi:MAG TPA: superoxide dismutase [Alphaproteobacteria bacterium]|jgi:Fe-Mn family superoxide dismutase|nr:superoxide dismutase [Alphaproteobacteria bacterium]